MEAVEIVGEDETAISSLIWFDTLGNCDNAVLKGELEVIFSMKTIDEDGDDDCGEMQWDIFWINSSWISALTEAIEMDGEDGAAVSTLTWFNMSVDFDDAGLRPKGAVTFSMKIIEDDGDVDRDEM